MGCLSWVVWGEVTMRYPKYTVCSVPGITPSVAYLDSFLLKLSHPHNSTIPTPWNHCGLVIPDSKVHGVNMGPHWVLSAPDGLHISPMNPAIRDVIWQYIRINIDSGNSLLPDRSKQLPETNVDLSSVGSYAIPKGNSIWNPHGNAHFSAFEN